MKCRGYNLTESELNVVYNLLLNAYNDLTTASLSSERKPLQKTARSELFLTDYSLAVQTFPQFLYSLSVNKLINNLELKNMFAKRYTHGPFSRPV